MNSALSQASSETVPIIQVHGASLSFPTAAGKLDILRGVELTVHAGETVAVVGPSGSGKTSLLMLLAGLEAPTHGRIHVCGVDITHQDEDALARWRGEHIGIVFQAFHLIPSMTALENVAIPLEFGGRTQARTLAAEALTSLGLGHRLHHYPAQLSGGEQQRVAIARAFAMRPKLLLADEPTGNLDLDTGARVIDLLFDLQKRFGTTLVLITHDTAIAERCDRILRIADGRLMI